MINRRSFFKSIGAAVLGTAIALRLPETIVPTMAIRRIKHGWIIAEMQFQFELEKLSPRRNGIIYGINC